jgi:hypothetical protein
VVAKNNKTMVLCRSSAFCLLAKTTTNTKSKRSFKAKFGTSPEVCSELWERLQPHQPKGALPKHLLRALMFLKLYSSEDVLSDMVGTMRKTFRRWVWLMVQANLKIKPQVVRSCIRHSKQKENVVQLLTYICSVHMEKQVEIQ